MQVRVLTLLAFLFVVLVPASAATAATTPTPSPGASASPDAGGDDAAPPADEASITVRLFDNSNDDAPVPGVTLDVTTDDGEEIGSFETDENGQIFTPIPGPGTYLVTLDEDTLPDGVELAPGTASQIEIRAILSTALNGSFPIGVQENNEVGFGQQLVTSVLSGVKFGFIVALAALGLSLIFGTTGLTNFAHGELITLGAIICYVANRGFGLPVILAGVVAVVVSAAFGYLQDRGLWRPLRRRGTGLIAMMIISIGVGLFLRNLFQYFIGGSRRSLSEYVNQARNDFGIIQLADKELAIMGISLVVIVLVCLMLLFSRLGKSMRAVSDNPALAASSGMRVDGVISAVWILGAALTGLSGVLLAVNSQINFLMGFRLLLLVFAAVTLGGLGTIWGALFGSMVIGIMVEVGPLFGVPSSIKEVGALVVLILVLLIRPQGILGRRQRVG